MSKNISSSKAPASTFGLDLSDKTADFCHLDRKGSVVERGQLRLSRADLRKYFGSIPRARIALEACGQSAWVEELLASYGHEVIVANPRDLRSITSSSRKSDVRDAEQLARLARVDHNLLRPITHRSAGRRLDIMIIRSRAALVECRTRLVNSARGMAKVFGERIPSCSTSGFAARALNALSPMLGATLRVLVEQVEALSLAIHQCDQQIEELATKMSAEVLWLQQVPGVGPLTAVTFVLTLDNAERFAHSRDVGPYLGLAPGRKQSGDHDPHLGISKCGDTYLRKLLVQCSQHILGRFGKESALREWGLRHAASGRKSKRRAIVAVARKLAVLLHRLWKDRVPYRAFPLPAVQQALDHQMCA